MRRPMPLPLPAHPVTDAADRGLSADEPAGRTERAAGTVVRSHETPASSDGAVAALIPLTEPAHMQRPSVLPSASPAGEHSDPIVGTAGDSPVRVQQVWAAARARRKALRAEVRRFTSRQRRRRLIWFGGMASVLLLVLATLGAAYSPLFAVEQIRIVGSETLDALALEAALADQMGTPLALVDESAVKAALVAFPVVESYTLEARPPHELVVRIVERTPIGLIQTRAGYTLVDAAGVALSTTETPAPGHPLVTVVGGTGSAAFESVGLVMRSLPDGIRDQVTAVAATTPNDVTLTLGGSDTQVVWGSAEDSAMKALVLEKAMTARPPASVLVYDVSSPSAIVVR